mmetsp:Transcript_21123/g.64347  ORF Transcript_21123/g.64347 Transcript_21123/m.64347 type:complete len:107 (-) Transcript_21123:137-457(-)|eukprot:CAMPEP_0118853086 /NCGR_PEP_ID=MMETSP1163-20130328/1808_1 /TAXON_ID=124430 /ORGANISM="Phaeomonas parva, Strain CCMP2877" /LENGTH=106 /DNA_ID=CAMNT_0006785577 /DNA_START=141 /DNA_END=461 /DNA_ORIENTATION=-
MASKEGVLVTCDVPVRELIMHLDEQHHFVLEELDDEHLMVDPMAVDRIREAVAKLMDSNFEPPREMQQEEKTTLMPKKPPSIPVQGRKRRLKKGAKKKGKGKAKRK